MTKVEYAVQWAISIANDESHGYSQYNRWGPDYDCSSLVISAYQAAGIPVKDNGAQRTGDMYNPFIRCGFIDVTSQINMSNGAGLIAGDVVLMPNSHVEMSIGGGQLVGAHIDENGGVKGTTKGDQTGKEISIRSYYNHPWRYVLRYVGNDLFTGDVSSLAISSYYYGLTGSYVSVTPNYEDIDCYMITLDHDSNIDDLESLKEIGVVGAIIEEGGLYDITHTRKVSYVSPKLDSHVSMCKDADIPYGFYSEVRARSVYEANTELSWLRIYAEKYVPPLGMWLSLNLQKSKDKSLNDSIIERYKTVLTRAGFSGKMGLYTTREQLDLISWDKWKSDFMLLLIDHVSDISELQTILTPEFFMLKKG